MQVTIDRIEGGFAVIELPDLSTVSAPLALFPDAQEGDIYTITKDSNAASERQEHIDALRKSLFTD